jgi:ribosomal protein L11 methyltransferase
MADSQSRPLPDRASIERMVKAHLAEPTGPLDRIVTEIAVRRVAAAITPERVGRLLLVPSWLQPEPTPGEVVLRITLRPVFGSGLHHPTTLGVLTLLQALDPMPSVVLDVGSGSGILALAALQLGAERAVCYDTDPLAVEATLANAAINGLADRVTARHGSLAAAPIAGPYKLVLANLQTATLLQLLEPLAAHVAPGGTLLVTSIERLAGEVQAALADAGLLPVEELWVDCGCVVLRMGRPA